MVTTEEVEIGLKIPATIPIKIVDKLLIMMGEVDIGIIPATIPLITHVEMIEELNLCINIPSTIHLIIMEQLLMVMIELDICPRPATIPSITQVGVVEF